MKRCIEFIKNNWGKILLGLILLAVVSLNFKWGYLIMGNDNYSPELDPELSLNRFLRDPGWRKYRVVGVASDADQADVYRTLIYWILSKVLPTWVISQGFVFFCLFVGVFATAKFVQEITKNFLRKEEGELVFLFSGLVYLFNLLGVWIFFSPLNAFLAAWAFVPFVLWRVLVWVRHTNIANTFLLLLSVLFLATSSIVPTIFIVEFGVFFAFTFFLLLVNKKGKFKTLFLKLVAILFLFVIPQLHWLLPFVVYVKTNSPDLAKTFINRKLTPTFVEEEIKYNTAFNAFRNYVSLIEVKNNNGTDVFPFRNWYQNSKLSFVLSTIPLLLTFLGMIFLFSPKRRKFLWIPLITLFGWLMIKGINPPFGFIFSFLQENIPLFRQVFRWQSSKFWLFLSTTIPILSSLGLIFLIRIKGINRWFKSIFVVVIVVGLAIFVYPFFTGNLVRKENYVKVPSEYFDLANWLGKNDPNSRIYLSPEANTLYFRHYKWGFWGSSILNYILPNPIVEKALTTGSMEAENAQRAIEAGYYSQDPIIFDHLLLRFNTDLVLSDKGVSDAVNGYQYNWQVHRQVVEENPNLEIVWQKGDLTLYRLVNKDSFVDGERERVNSHHNWLELNRILAFLEKPQSYYSSQQSDQGDIYPLALEFNDVSFVDNEIDLKVEEIVDQENNYQIDLDKEEVSKLPTEVFFDKETGELILSPSLPSFKVNDELISFDNLPLLKKKVDKEPGFVSINGHVVDYRQSDTVVWEDKFSDFSLGKTQVYFWDQTGREVGLEGEGQDRPYLVSKQDSVVEVELETESDREGRFNFCFWSEPKEVCLSPNISSNLQKGKQKSTILIPEVVKKGEKITFFLEYEDDKNDSNIKTTLIVRLFEKRQALNFKKGVELSNLSLSLGLKPDDSFSVVVPRIYGPNQFHLSPQGEFIPEFANHDCSYENRSYPSINWIGKKGSSLVFRAANCYGSVFTKLFSLDSQDRLGFLAFKGENLSGIPLDVGFITDKTNYGLYNDSFFSNQANNRVAFINIPQETKNYFIDLFSLGLGPKEGVNRLDDLSFQFIPKSWLKIVFKPSIDQEGEGSIYGINQAVSPSWRIKNKEAEPIRIDGWQQGWILPDDVNDDEIETYFWPDRLAYLGYGLIILLIISLPLLPKMLAKKGRVQ